MAMGSATLWMGDIGPEMDKAFVVEAFANMGYTVIDVKEMLNKNGDRANYCFVDFGDVTIAREVLIKIKNEPIPGTTDRKFRLNQSEYGKGGTGAEVEHSLFVGDLSPEVTDEELLNFFTKKYSSVRAANIVKDAMGNPRGFGFVRFFNEEQHLKAIREMNGAKGLGQKSIRVNVASKSKGKGAAGNQKDASGENAMQQMDPANTPQWMQQQMQYIQQMHQYMQQCHQFAQQAATYAGWNQQQQPPPPLNQKQQSSKFEDSADAIDASSFIDLVEQEHAKMISETTEIDEDQELVDPNTPIDVAALNQEIIDRDDRLFFELEASRWDFEMSFLKAHEQRLVKTR